MAFMVGSTLFAFGSLPGYAASVDGRVLGATFVVGSLFFTAAAYGQFFQAINDAPRVDRRRYWAIRTTDAGWVATAVQLAGTILFNVSTTAAMIESLDVSETNRIVWAPDLFGSIAFLVASHAGWIAVEHRPWRVRRDDPIWWMAGFNYLGSVFFMASAIAAFTLPTGDVVNEAIVNSTTFAGAVCFLIGAYLLLPADPAPNPRAVDS